MTETKARQVLHAMGIDLDKNEHAQAELAEKGTASQQRCPTLDTEEEPSWPRVC